MQILGILVVQMATTEESFSMTRASIKQVMREMTNIKCFNLYRGLNSVDPFLTSICTVANGWQELGSSFHKQKTGENGMSIQED